MIIIRKDLEKIIKTFEEFTANEVGEEILIKFMLMLKSIDFDKLDTDLEFLSPLPLLKPLRSNK